MTKSIQPHSLSSLPPIVPQEARLLDMPLDIFTQIFRYLSSRDIATSSSVCRQWTEILKDNDVWRILFHHRFPSVNLNSIENFKSAYQRVYSNLTAGVYAFHTLRCPEGSVGSLAVFEGKLFSCSQDNTITVSDLKTGECTATLTGHPGDGDNIEALAIFDGKLFSGSTQGTIKVWDLKTGECKATLTGHTDTVDSLAVFDGNLCSGSWDNTIRFWDLETGRCAGILTDHEWVNCLTVFDGKLFWGSSNSTIKVWDLRTNQSKAILTDQEESVESDDSVNSEPSVDSIAIFGRKLFSGSSDGCIKVWDLKTKKCTATYSDGSSSVYSLAIFDGKLFSASANGTIAIRDLKTEKCTATLQGGDNEPSHPLAAWEGKLFMPSGDRIKVWDFTADHRTIFLQIAKSIEDESLGLADHFGSERFSGMPKTAKDAIYGKLYEILKPFANEYPGCAEDAFHNRNRQRSTPAQKARAIRDYLNDQPPITTL